METSNIKCQICQCPPSDTRPYFCLTCARSALYECRLQNAQTLLSKEALATEVESLTTVRDSKKTESEDARMYHATSLSERYWQDKRQVKESEERRNWILQQSATLKEEIEEMSKEVAKARERLAERRNILQGAQRESARKEHTSLELVKASIQQAESRWTLVRNRTADVKVFLCKELASLYGLIQRRRSSGQDKQEQYLLGQVIIVDLRDLNSASPSLMTVSAGRVAHFVYLASHYLSVRLPAEINLPSPSNPYPTITAPGSSYREPSIGSSKAREGSGASKSSRPRLLSLETPLSVLASEDPIAYSEFIEAMTLLAWDVAWLARTQGTEIGAVHWDEFCAIGKNLHALFSRSSISSKDEPSSQIRGKTSIDSRSSDNRGQNAHNQANTENKPSNIGRKTPLPSPGQLSHSSAQTFLCSSASGGSDLLQSWTYASPYKLIEKVKSALASERMGAEWELLEWDGEYK